MAEVRVEGDDAEVWTAPFTHGLFELVAAVQRAISVDLANARHRLKAGIRPPPPGKAKTMPTLNEQRSRAACFRRGSDFEPAPSLREASRSLRLETMNPLEFDGHRLARHLDVMARLQPEPPAVAHAEEAAQPQIGIGRDRTLASNDVADALRRHPYLLGEPILRQTQRLEKFLFQHFARRHRSDLTLSHGELLSVAV